MAQGTIHNLQDLDVKLIKIQFANGWITSRGIRSPCQVSATDSLGVDSHIGNEVVSSRVRFNHRISYVTNSGMREAKTTHFPVIRPPG